MQRENDYKWRKNTNIHDLSKISKLKTQKARTITLSWLKINNILMSERHFVELSQ